MKLNQFHSKAFVEAMKSFITTELSHRLRSRTDGRQASLMVTDRYEITYAHVYATCITRMHTECQDGGLVSVFRPQCRCVTPESSTLLHTIRSREGDASGKEEADTVEDRHRHMLIKRTPILRVLTRTSSSGAARMLRARLFA